MSAMSQKREERSHVAGPSNLDMLNYSKCAKFAAKNIVDMTGFEQTARRVTYSTETPPLPTPSPPVLLIPLSASPPPPRRHPPPHSPTSIVAPNLRTTIR